MSSAYHLQMDGATKRANQTIVQMICQSISPTQTDWVLKLPAVVFAINLACSESTGYSPFFLNHGSMPHSMIWNMSAPDEYAGVQVYTQHLKSAIMAAHDSILAACMKQVRLANRKCRAVPFEEGDLVYVATKNMTFPKGLAHKLIPKFVGPYPITADFSNHSFHVKLPSTMRQRGIHDSFHASLLQIHHPNNDRLFPGRLFEQVVKPKEHSTEWAADKILSHSGSKSDALFEVLWKSGNKTWLLKDQAEDLNLLRPYLEAIGAKTVAELPVGGG